MIEGVGGTEPLALARERLPKLGCLRLAPAAVAAALLLFIGLLMAGKGGDIGCS